MDLILAISPDLFLRVLRPYEAGTLFSLVQRNREHLREWLPWVDAVRNPIDSRRFLELSYAGFLRGAGFSFGIRYHGGLAGVIGFHGFDRLNRATSLGYWLGTEFCGHGIMRQAVSCCLEYAFEKQEMNRLYVRCAVDNHRSKRIPQAMGMVYEGTQRQAEWLYDHYLDLEVYSILASEWRGSLVSRI